ncbi:MAG: NAD(P)H-hydrate dehydratase [Nanoarchaeota archaeon]|nr:NAD(P)H-hydrate dehydratase [Nanoarchaeota archaeon]
MFTVNARYVRTFFPRRPEWSHKGDFGRLLVIGGSRRYTGAIALNALAALRTGTDYLTIMAPRRAADIAASFTPDLIAEPVSADYLTPTHLRQALELAKGNDAVLIGCGTERRPQTFTFIQGFVARSPVPVVIDDDGIFAVAAKRSIIKKTHIFTPQAHEFQILSGVRVDNTIPNRVAAVEGFVKKYPCTLLLKGHHDVMSDGNETAVNKTGNAFMTKAGNGCVLAGVVGSLLSRQATPFEAAAAGSFIMGTAGVRATRRQGPGTLASDIINELQYVVGGS